MENHQITGQTIVLIEVNGQTASIHPSAISEILQQVRTKAAEIPVEEKIEYQKALQAAYELESEIHQQHPSSKKVSLSAKNFLEIARAVSGLAPIVTAMTDLFARVGH
jgi:acetyl-CoA carboxylase carboxyltransferase component